MSNRSRFRQSSSLGEIGVFHPFNSWEISNSKPVISPAPETKKITFTVGSPERENSDEVKKPAEGFCEFLRNCYFCKKRFSDRFFMYGYLGAFCSHQCREHQMVLDGFEEEIARDIEMRMKSAEGLFKKRIPNLGF